MRILLALVLACCSPAPSADYGADHRGAAEGEVSARDLLETMFIENGSLSVSARKGFETSGQEIWRSWADDPGFANISLARREAIRAYLADVYPREATEEVLRGASPALDTAAPRVAAVLSASQIAQLDAFLRSDEGRTWFVAAVASGEVEYVPSVEESRALNRFAAETRGQVWTEEFNQLIYQITSDVIASSADAVRHRLFARVCELAGDDCPPAFAPDQ